jgi:hypothetical protein
VAQAREINPLTAEPANAASSCAAGRLGPAPPNLGRHTRPVRVTGMPDVDSQHPAEGARARLDTATGSSSAAGGHPQPAGGGTPAGTEPPEPRALSWVSLLWMTGEGLLGLVAGAQARRVVL